LTISYELSGGIGARRYPRHVPRRPLVVIPTYQLADGRVAGWVTGGYAVPRNYIHALWRAGARPLLLPAPDFDDAESVLADADALVLAGGGDVEPTRYGAQDHPAMYGIDPERDVLEVSLAVVAARLGVPTLAICRGFQVVNVAFGGTLFAHLPDVEGMLGHGVPAGGGVAARHDVKVASGSRLEAVCGSVVRDCVSHHHQGVDRVGDGLRAVAWSDDGLVEGLELDDAGAGFYVAVQWHPEMTAADDPAQQAMFDGLVAATRAR
jgi:putative glutamine amidotransferase